MWEVDLMRIFIANKDMFEGFGGSTMPVRGSGKTPENLRKSEAAAIESIARRIFCIGTRQLIGDEMVRRDLLTAGRAAASVSYLCTRRCGSRLQHANPQKREGDEHVKIRGVGR